jgi:tetratricopeptide (TPR) repeat protein
VALGRLSDAEELLERCREVAGRAGLPLSGLLYARALLATALGRPDEEATAAYRAIAGTCPPGATWLLGFVYSQCAVSAAREGRPEEALDYLGRTVPWLERAPAWTIGFPTVVHDAAEALWTLERLEHIEVVERAARDKVVAADFRCSMADGRLTMARLCSLQDRHDEALGWLRDARRVLEEQGARPLLAIADLDEARMRTRRRDPAEAERARALLDSARAQFEALGMAGWSRRADELADRLA